MTPSQDPAAAPRGASALSSRGFRWYFAFATAAVMADNVEHVISYWVMFQKFHSPVMGGFAVISHWVPHLLFAAWSGALADRVDVRRLIQVGMGMLALVSVGWGWLFQTDSVEMWKAAALLIAHGMAGVFWLPASQVLIHQLVDRERLPSAVRLNATSRYVGFLAGPALGAALLMGLGPKWGIWVNALLYAPMALLMLRIRYSGPRRAQPRDVRGIADILVGMRAVAAHPVLLSMTALIAASSFFIGSAYQAQMPGFAASLGRANADFLYSLLLAADAAGGLTAGVLLETRPLMQPRTRTAFVLAITWAVLLAGFAASWNYWLSVLLLFGAGFVELSYNAMAQTLVQIYAPADQRGRVIGVFTMAALGMRFFSGITTGLLGARIGIHQSLGASAACLLVIYLLLAVWLRRHAGEASLAR
ncbi:MAG: MFS transporter [Steroidobacteraceae bacterium]